jgi:Protein kinase C terminal domain
VKSLDDTSNFEDYGELPPLVSDIELTEEEQALFKGF